jgi:nicotinate-nucleotide pyrophosphorylase (carboxylating)
MGIWLDPEPQSWWFLVDEALAEDIGTGDLSAVAIPDEDLVHWKIEAQADGVVCGLGIAEYLFAPSGNDPENCRIIIDLADGSQVSRGDVLASGYGNARRILTAERTGLNFLMHLSGVATLTSHFVSKVDGTGARIVDTRKTLPGLRGLQKYAVRCGGGFNHRMGLYDAVMIKDNHIAAAGSITAAIEKIRRFASHVTKIEVEVESLEQLEEAVRARADIALLDNMDPFQMRAAVKQFSGQILLEASGGINLDTVRQVAQTGVDIISVGALTHSAPALAMHLEFD